MDLKPQAEKKGLRPEVSLVIAGWVVGWQKRRIPIFVQVEEVRGRIECSVMSEA